jgi:hypothetical protein
MTFEGVITIILYSLKPYWWLLVLLLVPLVLTQLSGWKKHGPRPGFLYLLCAVVGIGAALVAPALTMSKLSYVATTTDWLSLLAVAVGVAIYCFLLLSPVLRRAS